MLKYVKRITIFILVCVIVFTGIPVVNAKYYADVSKSSLSHEEFDSIMYVSDNGIMNGYDTGEFAPEGYLNRAQFVQTLYNYSGEDYSACDSTFTDVIEGSWYYDAVYWAYNEGLVNGTSDTTFHPARNITIAEALTILYRYANNMCINTGLRYGTETILTHSDYNSIADWAEEAMNWALDYNVINPASDSAPLNPNVAVRRKEIAVCIRNFEKEAVGFRDSDGSNNKLFCFTNDSEYFYGNDERDNVFSISDGYFNLLCRNVEEYYGANTTTARSLIETLNHHRDDIWGGSCFGMSATILFDALGKIDFNLNTEGMSHMSDLSIPFECIEVRDGINYYQMTPYILQYFRSDYGEPSSNMQIGVNNLIAEVSRNGATLMDYRWHEQSETGETTVFGHSILITEMYEIGGGWYLICMYDPNYGYTEDWLNITEDGFRFRDHTLSSFGYYRNYALDELDFIDIDGAYNMDIDSEENNIEDEVLESRSIGVDYLAEKTLIIVPAVDFELTNNEGERLFYSAEHIEGTMEVFYSKIISNGPNVAADMMLIVDESESFTYVPPSIETQSFFVTSDLLHASVIGENIDLVYVDQSKAYIRDKHVEEDS